MIKILQQAQLEGIKENTIYNCDCLDLMKLIGLESINLIYIDPPFGIKRDDSFGDSYNIESNDLPNECDNVFKVSLLKQREQRFLRFLYNRLILMKSLLKETGSIYVHLDWHVGHYVKLIMDDIFGKEKFRNEIIWGYRTGGVNTGCFAKKHDTLLFYSKNTDPKFNIQYYLSPQKYKYGFGKKHGYQLIEKDGKYFKNAVCRDVWDDIDAIGTQGRPDDPRNNFPTQKPEALLERIVKASSNEGDLVADFFCGSGTTLSVAEKLGRRWIGCDLNKKACEITENRIKNIRDR